MIEELKNNVETEIGMLRELSLYMRRIEEARGTERKILAESIRSLQESIKILNDSIPKILIYSTSKVLPGQTIKTNLEKVYYKRLNSELEVTVSKDLRKKLLDELRISEKLIRKLKKKEIEEKEEIEEFKAARGYLKISNRMFLDNSKEWIRKGHFRHLSIEIKKANIDILTEAYIAMMFFTSFISIFIGIFIAIFLLFFSFSSAFPFIVIYDGSYLIRIAQVIWIPFVLPVAVYFSLYSYPSLEKKSIAKRIDQELPFAVIHMGAISGSGIAPSEVFRIIGMSREYPALRKEIRKVLNQINLYGYDLVTALTNVSKSTPSEKLAELFSGLSTTIHSGGGLKEFFEKRGETLLIGYRLEREKYTRIAETFMDIYISVVIAAPMILMLLLILISISQMNFGLTQNQLTILIISIISVINIIFIGFLHLRQPGY